MDIKKRKYRPLPIRLLNKCGPVLGLLKIVDNNLDRDKLLAKSRKKTGLSEFGDMDFVAALDKLLESINADARLNVIGRLSMQTYLLQILTYRLRFEEDRKNNPQISNQKIVKPVFIVGLPRTGSTILFELLALDSRFQSPLTWEVMYPLFLGDGAIKRRVNQMKAALSVWVVELISPHYKKIHEIGGSLPQECIAIQSMAFQSIQYHTTNRLNLYQSWLERSNWSPAYRIHKMFLQHYQYLKGGKTWLLKAPGHMYSLDALFAAYPDARIIQTHRNPTEVIPSITSLSVELRQAFSDFLDAREVGEFSASSWHQALNKSLAWREAHTDKECQFYDVHYTDFIANQIQSVEDIYTFLGLEMSSDHRAKMHSYLSEKPQHKHGGHTYTLEEYGLSRSIENERYKKYIEKFNL